MALILFSQWKMATSLSSGALFQGGCCLLLFICPSFLSVHHSSIGSLAHFVYALTKYLDEMTVEVTPLFLLEKSSIPAGAFVLDQILYFSGYIYNLIFFFGTWDSTITSYLSGRRVRCRAKSLALKLYF